MSKAEMCVNRRYIKEGRVERCLLSLVCFLLCWLNASSQNLSNKGKEFWTGYGHHQFFITNQGNGEKMVLYLSAEAPANVTVSINGTSWSKSYSIPANTVIPTDIIPKSGVDDARILDEGLNHHAIHIVADTPIVAYAHIYGETSSGASMLLPVETYGYSYFSINTEQEFDTNCYSWFFVVANDNNTRVRITPSQPTVGGLAKGQTLEVDLQKGQIYNVMGKIRAGTVGFDLTGSKVESISGADGKCHPVAMFSGSSRTRVCMTTPWSGGGDNMIQQVFPASAWGNEYLTAPTTSTTSASILNNNKFRVVVKDRTTVVKRNGVRVTGLVNNFYYEFLSGAGDYITADKPIMVAQIMPSGGGCGTEGGGDPEMFYLSSLQQGIKKTSFYNTDKEKITTNYITLIIPTDGMKSLLIDGSNRVNYSYPHPQKAGYTVAIKRLATADLQHTVQSDSSFTAITYGMGFAESYGYNAGTLINNLDTKLEIKNKYADSSTSYTCANTEFTPILKTMYRPSAILWQLSKTNGIQPNADVQSSNLSPVDSVRENGRLYYLYPLSGAYRFADTGVYRIPVTITDASIGNCNATEMVTVSVEVKLGPKADFRYPSINCLSDSIRFAGITHQPDSIAKWLWDFGNGSIDTVASPAVKYAQAGSYNATLLVARAFDGCTDDTTAAIVVNENPKAAFELENTICLPSGKAVFSNQSTINGGNIGLQYEWSFGDGANSLANAPTHFYTGGGTYTVWLKAISSLGCSDSVSKVIEVWLPPIAAFNLSTAAICQNQQIIFTDKSQATNSDVIKTWQWDFGDGKNSSDTNTSHRFTAAGSFTSSLVVTSANGCADTTTQAIIIHGIPVASFTVSSSGVCVGSVVNFLGSSGNASQQWKFGDGIEAVSANAVHIYNAAGSYTVKYLVYSLQGCVDSSSQVIKASAKPGAAFSASTTEACAGSIVNFTNNTPPANGLQWQWNLGDGTTTNGISSSYTYVNAGSFTASLIARYANGCADTATQAILIKPMPQASFTASNAEICLGTNISFTGNTVTNANYQWSFADGNQSNNSSTNHYYADAGTYLVQYIIASQGCSDTVTKTITVNAVPDAAFKVSDSAVCAGVSISFNNTNTQPVGSQWQWTFGDAGTANNASPNHAYSSQGIYTARLIVATTKGCSDTSQKTIEVYHAPAVSLSSSMDEICAGGQILFLANGIPNNSGITGWKWNFGDGSTADTSRYIKQFDKAGTYTVTLLATNAGGCSSLPVSKAIKVHAMPQVNAGSDRITKAGIPVTLKGTAKDAISVSWSPAIYLSNPNTLQPVANISNSQKFVLTAFGRGDCMASDSILVIVQQALTNIPNAFSPNRDGVNDDWGITHMEQYPGMRLTIFDRWGTAVFTSLKRNIRWDGKTNGRDAPVGVYYFTATDGTEKLTGSIMLLR